MSVPVTGIFILIAAACFFLFWPRYLYPALIISIPFSATAVVNFGWSAAAVEIREKSLVAWQLFAILWIFREAVSSAPQWRRTGWFLTRRARLPLLSFLAAVIASWSVPLVLNGTSWVPSWKNWELGTAGRTSVALRFSSHNVTQSGYLIFGLLLAIFLAAENWSTAKLLYTLKLYMGSCLFAAAWGLFQLWCIVTGIAYPSRVFNTSMSITAVRGDEQTLKMGNLLLGRVSSVALEPVMLAQELLFAFIVLIICLGTRRSILPGRWNLPALMLLGAVLVATTSTTAYAGIFAAMALACLTLVRLGNRRWKYYPIIAGVVMAIGAILAIVIPLVNQLLKATILLKYVSGTGSERLQSVLVAAAAFVRHPILGAGWHEVDSYDLVFLLLANVGVIGFAAFGSFLFQVIKRLWRLVATGDFPSTLMLPALSLCLILFEGTGLPLIGSTWLVFGLAAGAAAKELRCPVAHPMPRELGPAI